MSVGTPDPTAGKFNAAIYQATVRIGEPASLPRLRRSRADELAHVVVLAAFEAALSREPVEFAGH